MRSTSTGVVAAAMVAFTGVGVAVFGTGVASGAPQSPSKPATFQMYANVDQLGDLGSNSGAKSVKLHKSDPLVYDVTFSKPIGSCAAQVQPGFAGGDLLAGPYTSEVVDSAPKTFEIEFLDTTKNTFVTSAFMITVTCQS